MPSDTNARQRSRWVTRLRARAARSAASSEAISAPVRRLLVVGGVAREAVESKRGPRVRLMLMASSIVRQGLLAESDSVAAGREALDVEDVDAVVGGERITEARRRGRRGLLFGRVAEDEPLPVLDASLLLVSIAGRL